ncbi:PREDICTED: uncharacterized protein LOC104814740 [Tarenaya hassleriana]|uniref:uncharacterized protein LOC104814740 n=1 Tax=Tarenaya hassleriana TaxID=28532 RepID=UPI00053C7389|nr:PREDICTED: uncharacterized protein LOC104814740 [Tarenaya hassleriana]
MEPLTKLLNSSARLGRFDLHSRCVDPLLTHLVFADDLIIFSRGNLDSVSAIMGILDSFAQWSGLAMNPDKSELYLGGLSDQEANRLSSSMGIRLGKLPMIYLGLPLSPWKLSKHDFQPLIDRIARRLTCWTSKFLSYAGRIQLISSVIYGMVNSWSQSFLIPKGVLRIIDGLCSKFLWKSSTSTRGVARVAWDDVCKPRSEGGLGIRKLEDFNTVFRLKLVWMLFQESGSLWVAWLWRNFLKRKGYWDTSHSPRFSWNLRKLLHLKPVVRQFLRCSLGDGKRASFWFDDWIDLGPLIEFVGEDGPRLLRIPRQARVADVVTDTGWFLPGARSPRVLEILIRLSTIRVPNPGNGADKFEWKCGPNTYGNAFPQQQLGSFCANLPRRSYGISYLGSEKECLAVRRRRTFTSSSDVTTASRCGSGLLDSFGTLLQPIFIASWGG